MSDKEAITTTDSPALCAAREQHALARADDPTKLGWTGLNLGRLLQLAGDREGARDAFQHAIDSADPDNAPVAAIGLGRLLAETGDPPGAADAYRIAARSGHKKQPPAAAYALGELLRDQGDAEGARRLPGGRRLGQPVVRTPRGDRPGGPRVSSRSRPPIVVAEHGRQVPVTVVCGFHGAGKSALIGHLRACPEAGRRVISGGLGERRELAAIRSDILWAEVDGIAHDERPDHLLVEAGGGEEPRQFAEALGGTLDGTRRCGLARLDTMLTVVDATSVLELCGPVDRLDVSERALVHHCVPSRGDVVAEQIEFADILVVNKVDLVGEDDLSAIVALLWILNPVARLLQARHGIVPTREVLATNRFDVTRTAGVAGWMAAMRGEPLPDVAGSASTSFVYRARRPFDAERLWRLLQAPWSGMLRAKGIFWLAQRSDLMGNWSQVGRALTLETTRDWWAARGAPGPTLWPIARR